MPDGAQIGILERLHTTLDRAILPDTLRQSGRALADRLNAPVRLSFMGLPGAGKTTLIQSLIGSEIPALRAELPSYELVYGDAPKTIATFEDGTRQSLDCTSVEALMACQSVFAELHLPLPGLQGIRVLELVTDGTADEMNAAVSWAAGRCDIPIWCSRNFTPAEARMWQRVPAAKKSHAMLVLTQADQVPAGTLSGMLEQAFGMQDADFCIIAPVAARHALRAQTSGRDDAENVVKASGVGTLRDEIFRRIAMGRRVDLDHAELFLSRFEQRSTAPAQTRAATRRCDSTPTSQPPEHAIGLAQGAAHVRAQTREMLIDIEEFGSFAPGQIVQRCLEAANTVVDLLAEEDPQNDAQARAHMSASDAADMLLLMTLENTSGAAEDAVNLMLQITHELDMAA